MNGFSVNGFSVNGFSVNGFSVNGFSVNGLTISGTSLQQWESSGQLLGAAVLSSSQLSVTSDSGRKSSDLVGAVMPAQLANGSTFKMRIDSVRQADGMWQYGVSLRADQGAWIPLCGADANGPILAIPLQGRYDSNTGSYTPDSNMFTFACLNGALGKCAQWGYRPWETRRECRTSTVCTERPLLEWHLACTRMVRADYCGDGVPHTRNGTQINIWDVFGIQPRAVTTWEMEAEWQADGAQCIRHTRWLKTDDSSAQTDLDYIRKHCPKRLAENAVGKTCDETRSNFNTRYGYNTSLDERRLLRNESNPSK